MPQSWTEDTFFSGMTELDANASVMPDRLQLALQAGDLGVWELDLATRHLDTSAIFKQHFGRQSDRPFAFADLTLSAHPDDAERVAAALERSMATRSAYEVSYRILKAPDVVGWIHLRAAVSTCADGTLRMVGISSDVTQQREAEENLRRTELLLRAVLETASGLIYAKDREGRMLIANPPALELIGKPWSKVKGRTDAEFLDDPQQGEAIMANDRRIMAGVRAEVLEEEVGTAQGHTRTYLSTKAPLRNDEGAVIGIVGISQNITDRKRAEDKLVELNETLEARVAERTLERDRAWNNSQDLLVVLDEAGVFKACNPAWTKVLGWSREEVTDHSFLDFIHPEDHPSSRDALTHANRKLLTHYENRYRHKDGTYRWIEWVAAPEGDRIYASGRHVTAEKAAAAALTAKTEQLEASNKELESFSYSISHDLRAPLRAIDGFGMMLEEDHGGQLDAEGRRLLSTIRANSQRMGLLIDGLLAFSRLSHRPLSVRDINVQDLVREVIDDTVLGHSGVRIEFDVDSLLPVCGDRGLLRQVFINLVSNAVKYSSKVASPKIQLRSCRDGSDIVYSIRDNGVGFDMKYADKLFGVFQRLHTTSEFSGTGVGLAIVQRIINRHGGRVFAEGVLNEGAVFSFSLPSAIR